MKNLTLLFILSFIMISCKKEEVTKTCSETFMNKIYDANDISLLIGTWKSDSRYLSSCKDDVIPYFDEFKLFFTSGSLWVMENGIPVEQVTFNGDNITFEISGNQYDLWELSYNELILGKPNQELIRYKKQ
jgi:hypothetical protein